MTYTVAAEGYETKTINAQNENSARSAFASEAGWMSDMTGYNAFWSSLDWSISND